MIRIFGDQSLDEFASGLMSLEENFKLKKMSIEEYESKKVFNFHIQKSYLSLLNALRYPDFIVFLAGHPIKFGSGGFRPVASRQNVPRNQIRCRHNEWYASP